MLRFWTTIWIALTIILISFPLWLLVYFLTKRFKKTGKFLFQKFHELKALDKMRQELLEKRVQENEEDNIRKDIDESTSADKDTQASLKTDGWSQSEWIVQEGPDSKVSEQTHREWDIEKDKEKLAKEKKLLEKLHYEALVLKKEWKLDDYEKILIEGLAIDPKNKEFNQLLADLYFTMWNYNKALSLLKKIIEADPKSHNAIRQIGEIYLITGDFETAELLIEKAIALKPSNPKYHISMVEVLYNTDRKKEAINIMEKVVRLRPTNTSYIFTLANLYEEIGDLDSAKKYYFRVLEYEPSNENAKKKLKALS